MHINQLAGMADLRWFLWSFIWGDLEVGEPRF